MSSMNSSTARSGALLRKVCGAVSLAVALAAAGCDGPGPSGAKTSAPTVGGFSQEPERATADGAVLVSPDNFTRAESDLFFSKVVADDGFGKLHHNRELSPVDHQLIIRQNRDTLYSAGVFDLDAAPVSIALPDSGGRFMSMQVISEDEYVPNVFYGKGEHTLTRNDVGTRYVLVGVRTLVDPNSPADVAQAHALQDAISARQDKTGLFDVPRWDKTSQDTVRAALLQLAATLPDSKGMFGAKGETDPVRRLVGSASAWGGNPERDAYYLTVTPPRNDGAAVYRLDVGAVPVDGFWSITVYDKDGYLAPNPQNAYSLNNFTARPGPGGGTTVQFGGCGSGEPNCLPVTPGWSYLVRLYRPRPEVLSGAWTFPAARQVG